MIAQRDGTGRLGSGLGSLGSAALIMVLGAPSAIADGGVPTDQEIARSIARGVDYLKASQGDDGAWNEPVQGQHRLGVTALAGLALMENGVARDDSSIQRAREVVAASARRSDQTYDL